MKQPVQFFRLKWFLLVAFLSVFNVMVWAQDSGGGSGSTTGGSSSSTTTSVTKSSQHSDTAGDTTWYTSPWVWVIGAAVFILLLVALLNNRGGRDTVATSDRVTVKKTVERDTDTGI